MLRIRVALMRLFLSIVTLGVALVSCEPAQPPDEISGKVLDEHGPVADAVVRVQTTETHTTTNVDGKFTLAELEADEAITVTAWKSGYYIAGVQEVFPGTKDVEIHIESHTDSDNPDYEWLPSQYHPGQGEDQGCAECHSNENGKLSFDLPVDEWLQDAHSQSAVNLRVLTMYTGTDMLGNQSPPTRFGTSRDYGKFP